MIIGVNGFKGAGKDTVADYLVKTYGFKKLSFAASLKQSVAALFNITLEQIEEWKNFSDVKVSIHSNGHEGTVKFPEMTFRQFLQRYGTEAHRDVFGYHFWVNHLMLSLDWEKDYVIADARFDNELEAIKGNSGINWCVERPGYEGEDHASEVAPDPDLIDYYIYNNEGLGMLNAQTEHALRASRKLAGECSEVIPNLRG